jgi:hypothetical protein
MHSITLYEVYYCTGLLIYQHVNAGCPLDLFVV